MPEDVTIEVTPDGEEPPISLDAWRVAVLGHQRVREVLRDFDPGRVRVSDPEVLGRQKRDDAPFVATVFDPGQNRALQVTGRLDALEDLQVRPSVFRPNPSSEELRDAADLLRRDARFPAGEDVVIYQPMPPLADFERDDGTTVRRLTLGILDPGGPRRHRFVAVDVKGRRIEWDPPALDHGDGDCEEHLPIGVESLADAGGLDRVRVRVLRGGEELWSMVVVRPRNSSPNTYGKGSGVELRRVTYRGRLVLWRAHVPILNVLYDDGVTFRDWQNQETPFLAEGSDPVGPGWRLCTSAPETILESGTDAGNFQGVAFHYADEELRIVGEVQAGWYRYVSDWRLRDDGTILPRFGFAGTRNPRTCMRHQHHVYWRMDFDIDGAGRDVIEQRGSGLFGLSAWRPIVRETSRKRGVSARAWRVRDRDTGRGYTVVPGVTDGTADVYGVADVWALRYHGGELDDGVALISGTPAQTQVNLDQYLTGESIDGTDVVVWYAGHFLHDEQNPSPHQGHIIGPELRPTAW